MSATIEAGVRSPSPGSSLAALDFGSRYAAWFHDFDGWTEYWDIFHPETRGRFYFGDGAGEPGLLSSFLPRRNRPVPFAAWVSMASGATPLSAFRGAVQVPAVAHAVMEVDGLLDRLFSLHFGDPGDLATRDDYLEAVHRFATDTLPAAPERAARVPQGDSRQRTAGRHTVQSDQMWFAWALHTEAAQLLGGDQGATRRRLVMAGLATGCAASSAWRGHRRTRAEYFPDDVTAARLRALGMRWADDFEAGREEIHSLYRLGEWGHD